MAITTMPFGKHKGTALTDLRPDYIRWLLSDFDGLRPPLRQALESELRRRDDGGEPDADGSSEDHEPRASSAPDETRIRQVVREELASLFRRLATAMEREAKR